MFFHEEDIYYFGKVFSGLKPEEAGILVSKEMNIPCEGEGDTIRVKSEFSVNGEGYFGFRLINSTGNYDQTVYIRPYAVYNGIMNVGVVKTVDFSGAGNIGGLTGMDSWLSKNRLNGTEVTEYTY